MRNLHKLKGCVGVLNITDDILEFGATQEEHDHKVISFLERCLEVNLKLNTDKVRLNCKKVPMFNCFMQKMGSSKS